MQRLIELGGPLEAVFVECLAAIVFGLEGEFTTNGAFMVAITPDRNGRLGLGGMR